MPSAGHASCRAFSVVAAWFARAGASMVTSPPNPGTMFHIEEHGACGRAAAPGVVPPPSENSMAKDAIVSDEFAKKFAAEKETPYTRWVKSEGLDLISSTYVPSLHTVE